MQQIPALSLRKEFSTGTQKNASSEPGPAGNPPKSGTLPKVLIGSVAVGAAFFAAYQSGYLDQFIGEPQQSSLKEAKIGVQSSDVKDIQHSVEKLVSNGNEEPNKFDIQHPGEQLVPHESEEPNDLSPTTEQIEQKVEAHSDAPHLEPSSKRLGKNQSQVQHTHAEGFIPVGDKELLEHSERSKESNDQSTDSEILSEGSLDIKSTEENASKAQDEIGVAPVSFHGGAVLKESGVKTSTEHLSTENRPEVLWFSQLILPAAQILLTIVLLKAQYYVFPIKCFQLL